MFTSFLFSLVITQTLGLEWIWSSDSDTIMNRDTLSSTTSICASDKDVGGACASLVIHNRDDNLLTRLSAAVYLSDYYLARSFPSAFGANECQSGPCALFRASTLAPILLSWYTQTVMGRWMRINEDRHLTTLLLRRGYRVLYAADAVAETESPPTLRRWLLQQVRWSRACHVEGLLAAPAIYVLHHPVLFLNAVRRELGAVGIPLSVSAYALTGYAARSLASTDMARRLLVICVYLALRSPCRPRKWTEWLWLLPGQAMFSIAAQGIQLWALLTMLDGDWGTCMRSSTEVQADATGESHVDTSGSILQKNLESGLLLQASGEIKTSRVRRRIQEVGFFVVWVGFVAGALVRAWASGYYEPLGSITTLLTFGSMVLTWFGMTWWMVTVSN
jgi:hyaluronan synthase